MALTISPNTPQTVVIGQPLCFEGSGIVSIPQEDLKIMNIPSSGPNWTFNISTGLYKKVSGGDPSFSDAIAISPDVIYGKQPFEIRGSSSTYTVGASRNVHWYIGVIDDLNNVYAIQVMKYCNGNGGCGGVGAPGQTWVTTVQVAGSFPHSQSVNFNETSFVRSDGINLYFGNNHDGVIHYRALPTSSTFRFFAEAAFVQNEISFLYTSRGTYQGSVAITWSAPLGGTLTGTANNQCFTVGTIGDYTVCIDSEFDDPLCVNIHASALEFAPVGLDCGGCVFTNQIVEFTSNGGLTGILTALDDDDNPVGTVIDALTWQAPGNAVHVTLRYTLAGDYVECQLNVIPTFRVINIEGDTILGMVPGETIQLQTNYEYMGGTVVWESLDCPNIITPEGYLTIPANYRNNCFGSLDCYIRVRAVLFPGGIVCSNFDPDEGGIPVTLDFRVIVDPIFPTPEYGGPNWKKWKPETPDFRVITKTMEGGCAETHIRNRVPIQRWMVSYSGLKYSDDNICIPVPCCDDPLGFVNGVNPDFHTAKMLDDFWMLVGGQYGFFTLVDPRTGYIWRRVRFEGTMERDHINWRRIQSRSFTLIWNPCCATEPAGGICPHNTVREDTFPPSVPSNVQVVPVSWSALRVSWDASVDNVGIKYYEISIDQGEPIQLGGTSKFYTDTRLEPTSTHRYKVRAIDTSNNPSDWSNEVAGTTFDHDIEPPTIPTNLTVAVVSDTQLTISWTASTDNISVGGYMLIADNYVIDVGLATSYSHTGLDPCSTHEYYVRAYDTSGNKSHWSAVKVNSTTCPQLLEGVDDVIDGANSVVEG